MSATNLSWTIIGAAALVLALSVFILARLRWIQTRPMKACIVLSVLAHLLFIAAFHLSRVFDVPFIPGGEDAMVIHVKLDDAGSFFEEELAEPAEPDVVETIPVESLALDPDEPDLALEFEPEAEPELDFDSDLEPAKLESVEDLADSQPDQPGEFDDLIDEPSQGAEVVEPLPQAPPTDLAIPDMDAPLVSPIQPTEVPLLETTPIEAKKESHSEALVSQSNHRWESAAAQVPRRYRDRIQRPDAAELESRGGNPHSEQAVDMALHWLANAQADDGRWSARRYGAGRGGWIDGQNRGSTGISADTGITGLAVLAFLGAGHTHERGEYRDNMQKAIDYLMSQQDSRGGLYGNASIYARMYCHGIASLALCEAAAITRDDRVRDAAQQAIKYTIASQHRQTGGWRYSPGDRGDTSMFGWQLMALTSAREAGIEVPTDVTARLKVFLRSVQRGAYDGLACYRPGQQATPSMTAEALACRMFLNEPASRRLEKQNREAAQFLSAMRPGNGQRNFYYWYYGTVALSQLNDEHWPAWNRALQRQLLPSQRKFGRQAGSWEPDTVWGGCGGRVYSTAMAALCLESYYRYAPRDQESDVMITERTGNVR